MSSSRDKRLPVTVLSGFLGAGKSSMLENLLRNRGGLRIALIVNDMAEVNIDAQLVRNSGAALNRVEEKLIELQNGCICCTLREDLLVEVKKLAKENRFDYLVIESTGIAEPLPVAETFTFTELGASDSEAQVLNSFARLDTMVTVVDAANFPKNLASDQKLSERFGEENVKPEDERNVVDLLIDQIEFANVVVVNKIDLATAEEVTMLEGMIHRLNPDAKVICTTFSQVDPKEILNTNLFDFDKASLNPGWLREIRGSHKPESDEYGISSFVYRRRRPFHPQRLWDAIENDEMDRRVIRSKGFFWLATRNDCYGEWSQAGEVYRFEYGGEWFAAVPEDEWEDNDPEIIAQVKADFDGEFGDRRQELVFIGMGFDKNRLQAVLDSCLLTDDEMAAGEDEWMDFEDPFDSWDEEDDDDDEAEDENENENEDEDEDEDEDGCAPGSSSSHGRHHHHHHSHTHSSGKEKKVTQVRKS
eukprot:ANDGO_07016.mRNA.1 Putative metal chaperone YciC